MNNGSGELPFKTPPITEAIFDIRTELPKETDVNFLLPFQDQIKDRFPTRRARHAYEAKFQFSPHSSPEAIQPLATVDGYLFLSPDGKKIVQARLDGFTFNKLKPYSRWEDFSEEAIGLWNHYVEIAKPTTITRLALRYINRIELPFPINDFKEYILTIPEIAPNLPAGLSGLFTRLILPNPKIGATAIITETLDDKNESPNTLGFIFDIDVFRNLRIEPNLDKVRTIMNDLRNYKNEIFLNSLTKKTKELFK